MTFSHILAGVIFDMDGVLVDSHPAHRRAWSELLESIGHPVPDDQLDFILDGHKREEILSYFLGPLSVQQLADYGLRKDQLFNKAASEISTLEGLMDFLDELELADIPKAVATSASKWRTYELLKRFHLKDRFRCIVTGDDVLNGKPNPELFQLAGQSLWADNNRLVVIEDAPSGVKAAKAAGMKCLGMTSSVPLSLLREAGADAIAANFHEVSVARLEALFTDANATRLG